MRGTAEGRPAPTRPGAPVRAALLVVGVLGAFLVAVPLATGSFAKAAAVDRFTADFEPEMDPRRLDASAADVVALRALSRQLQEKALPTLAAAQGQEPEAYRAALVERYPDFGRGLVELDGTLDRLDLVIARLDGQRGTFSAASDLPTAFLPMRAVPVLFLASGLGLLVLAVLAWRSRSLGPRAAIVAFGLAVVAVPLLWSVPAKTQAVDDLTAATRPLLGRSAVDADVARIATAQAMVAQLHGEVLPGIAEDLGQTPAEFDAFLADQYPDIAAGLDALPTAMGRFQRLVDTADRGVDDFADADHIPTSGTPTTLLTWLLTFPAGTAAGIGLLALLLGRRPRRGHDHRDDQRRAVDGRREDQPVSAASP